MYYSDFLKYKEAVYTLEKQLVAVDHTATTIMKILGDFGYLSQRDFHSFVYHYQGLRRFISHLINRCYLVRVDEEK